MSALIITIIILAAFLLTSVGVNGGVVGKDMKLQLRVGLIKLNLLPKKKKYKEEKAKKPKKSKKKKPKKADTEKAVETKGKAKKKPKLTIDDILVILRLGLEALSNLRRHLRIDFLRLHYVHATKDPFKTATEFGYATMALSSLLPLIENAFDIKDRDYKVYPDFVADKPYYSVWLTMSIQIWELFYVALAFGIGFIKHLLKKRQIPDNENPNTIAKVQTAE